ncbi:hypothetical protein MUN78_16635 [Leucobacter allii]|uniref:Uncharacterized protein n=1 Tax=Leucobacter allii TaxID=2932247 RepID=A0ABY4FLT8_9MICO|nr:hypothetical protein [Leucobacter allii]UOQ57258.1 hypothetical protein MUN78_16635 [Leucobacter allii]
MPYIQIETDLWAVMRDPEEHPVAMIQCIMDRQQLAKFLVLTWHPEPHRRRLVAMYDSLEEANRSVRWPTNHQTGRENHRGPGSPHENNRGRATT